MIYSDSVLSMMSHDDFAGHEIRKQFSSSAKKLGNSYSAQTQLSKQSLASPQIPERPYVR